MTNINTEKLQDLNSVPADSAEKMLLRCCGSARWAHEMESRRPFVSFEEICMTAETIANKLSDIDWLEAFNHHPRIGDRAALAAKFATNASAWEAGEQSGADGASDDVLDELASGNAKYEQKFGFIFLICATGKSAQEMLDALNERIINNPADELAIAAGEQRKITKLRLEKLLT